MHFKMKATVFRVVKKAVKCRFFVHAFLLALVLQGGVGRKK